MKKSSIAISAALAVLLGFTGYGLYSFGLQRGKNMAGSMPDQRRSAQAAAAQTGMVDPATGKKILYWHDPMVPGQKFDKPGKSPFMDMQLVPVYADGDGDQGQVSVSPRVQQNLGIRTAEVTRGTIAARVEAAGSIAYNERDQAVVQARTTGYVERLYVRATLDRVSKGQVLADLYVPDWVAAQEEFLSVRRMQGSDLAALVDGARQRMRQAGMNDDQIRLIESSGKVHPRISLAAPIGGVLVELTAREGMTVMAGATLFRINGLSTVWANAEVPESQAALVRPGTAVQARSAALPGTLFQGNVQAILPEVNPGTRTLKARVELANPRGELVPGMFVSVALAARAEPGLMVPTEAIIQTGKRTIVMLADGSGKFRPVQVEIGGEAGGQTEIRRGLEAGQKVVTSGQFLLDSEASLKGTISRMSEVQTSTASTVPKAVPEHGGEGRIISIDASSLLLSHGPIPSIQWGAMTMEFKAPANGLPAGLKAGQTVRFSFVLDKDGEAVLTRIEPAADGKAASAMEKKP